MSQGVLRRCILGGVLLLFPFAVVAGELVYSGYLKTYALQQHDIDIDGGDEIDAGFQSQNALRLMGSYFTDNGINVELHYEVQPLYRSKPSAGVVVGNIESTLTIGANRYRYKDLEVELANSGDHFTVLQNLDRFNLQYSHQQGDLTIGRQVLSFGSARFINPTDIFIPFGLQTLNQEYRVGIDAIRYQVDTGDFAVLDMGLVIGKDAKRENNAAFFRAKNSIDGNDVEAMFIQLDEAWLLGGGIERALGDFGFWFEAAFMQLDDNNDTDHYWRSSIGADYAFNENVIGMLEFHYSGAGSSDPDNYRAALAGEPYQKAGVYLLGKHYLIPSISWTVTPLFTVSGNGFFNLNDDSVFVTVNGEMSWGDNLYSDVGLYLSYGDDFKKNALSEGAEFGSEFGSYPLSLYVSLRYYY